MTPIITLRGINKRYGTLQVLHDVDLQVMSGEVMAICGPSGAGKTTLLQIMGTLDRPDSGAVDYCGTDVMALDDKRLSAFRNKNIGFVFQFHQLLEELDVEENIALPAMIGGASLSQAKRLAQPLIEYLGLADRLRHRPSQLSGGESQRVAVARALINKPAVVFADEPSGSLDSHNRNELHRLFFDLRRDLQQTFVIVTHDETLAARCDRIIHMVDGRINSYTTNSR